MSSSGRASPEDVPRRSHPAAWSTCVKRSYKEWALTIVLLALLAYSETVTDGRRMYITDHMLEAIKFPHVPNTVPAWAVPLYSLVGPTAIMAIHGPIAGHADIVTHTAILSSIFATAATGLSTNIFKMTVGRPRPDFFYRCFPDGQEAWRSELPSGLRTPLCHPTRPSDVIDGYKSFPSGHTSWTFAAFMSLSLYLLHFCKASGGASNTVELLLALLPLGGAAWIGMTRVIDNYHNPSDVLAGALLGSFVAAMAFYVHFPFGRTPKSQDGGVRGYEEADLLPV